MAQGGLHGIGVSLTAHQHRHVAGLGVLGIEQFGHVVGKDVCGVVHIIANANDGFTLGAVHLPHGHAGVLRALSALEGRDLARSFYFNKLNRRGALCGAKWRFNLLEHMVDGVDQTLTGAVVGVERVQRLRVQRQRIGAGLQVGVEVGTTEAVDGLFGVANHDEGVAGIACAGVVNAV